jgi:RNA polymerase sigma-70 factor (ECF subfamily)
VSRTRSSLLSRVRSLDDGPSWEEFDRLYRPLLVRYAIERGLSPDEAEEIAQQCMTAITEGIQSFRRRVSFRGWLRGMIDHKVKDQLKRRRREAVARTADLEREQSREDNPALMWERHWNKMHLLYCLNRMKEEVSPLTYEAFEMYVIQELPVAEIAERLGMTPNQVYVAKHRVISRLKTRWAEMADGLI